MTHDKPYIIPHTADTPAILSCGGRLCALDPSTALLWIHRLSDYLYSHNVVVLPEAVREVVDE